MKKLVIAFLICVGGVPAFASGKLSVQGNVYEDTGAVRPAAGFSIYQKLMKNIAFNGFAGVGIEPFELREDVVWTTVKSEVNFYNGRHTLSPGVAIKDTDFSGKRSYGYIKYDFNLW